MRVLRLLESDGVALDLHPYVTIIRGLESSQRDALLSSFSAIPKGQTGGLSGLVEAHGVVLDFTEAELALLDLDSDDIDPVVTVADLPGQGETATERQIRYVQRNIDALDDKVARAEKDVERHRERVAEAESMHDEVIRGIAAIRSDADDADALAEDPAVLRADLEQAVADARNQLAGAETALSDVTERRSQLEAETAEIRERRGRAAAEGTALAGQLEAAESALDPDAPDEVAASEARLEETRSAIVAERGAEEASDARVSDEPSESPEVRLARLEVRRSELDAMLAVLGGADTTAVEHAMASVEAERTNEKAKVLSPEALALADELADVEAELDDTEGQHPADAAAVAEARERLDRARQALAEAEHEVRVPQLDREDVELLEQAHAVVLDAQDKVDGRFAGARSERRLEEARAAEREILDRLGFDSYADYMMGTSILNVDDEREAALDQARVELAEAEDAWAALQSSVDGELASAALHERHRVLRERAVALLGHDPGEALVGFLRDHTVDAPSEGDATAQLAQALQTVGLAVAHEDLESDELVEMAQDWLIEEDSANTRREEVLSERAEVDIQLSEARSQLSQAAAGMAGPSPEDRRKARLDEANRRVEAARERARRHELAQAEVAELRAALASATKEVEAADRSVEDASRSVEEAATAIAEAEKIVDDRRRELAEAQEALDGLDAPDDMSADDEVSRRLAAAEADEKRASRRLEERRDALRIAESRRDGFVDERQRALDEIEALRTATEEPGSGEAGGSDEEVEWYLLSRLAAQRQLSYAGSVPFVIDRALDDIDPDEAGHLLERLERMAAAVQLVVVSDSEAIHGWADHAGEQRAAVVEAVPSEDLEAFA